MKRALAVAILFLTGMPAFAQSLSQADRENAIKYLENTRQRVITATKDLSEDQWNFDPGSGRWSIAEELEHIAAAEDLYFTLISQLVMKAPPRPPGDDVRTIDEMIMAKKTSGEKALGRDEPVPSGRFDSPDAALTHFVESRDQTIQFLKDTDNLRAHAMEGPMAKKRWDAYQWILFMAAHTDQHLTRILEVKAEIGRAHV